MKQSLCQTLADSLTGRKVKLKQLRGRCGIFVPDVSGSLPQATPFIGGTWKAALTKLEHDTKTSDPLRWQLLRDVLREQEVEATGTDAQFSVAVDEKETVDSHMEQVFGE